MEQTTPETVFRVFDELEYANDFVQRGIIRLGRLDTYKRIEDAVRKDSSEGNIAKTDDLVWNTVVDVHRDSYLLKEEYRQDFLRSVGEVREETDDSIAKLKNKLRRLQKDRARVEETLAKFETDILLRKTSADPKLMRSNLNSERDRVGQELEATKAEIEWKEAQKSWVNWLGRFNSEIEQKNTLTDEEKKEYLAQIVEEIRVYFDEEANRHNLEIEFKVPIVGDEIIYKDPKRKAKGWTIQRGETVLPVQELELSNRGRPRLKKQETDGKKKPSVRN